MLASQLSWMRWRQKRMTKRLQKELTRLALLEMQRDSSNLLVKELQIRLELSRQQEQERLESRLYRQQGQLPPAPPKTELDLLLDL